MRHIQIFENFQTPQGGGGKKTFTDAEITYYERLWNWTNVKYHNNRFFTTIWNKLKTKKELTNKQWLELEFLLKNGKSRYEAGQLSTKN